MKRFLLTLVGGGSLVLSPALAQETQAPPADTREKEGAQEDVVKLTEVITVTGGKVETKLIDAPVSMSLVTSQTLTTTPVQSYADLLRSVPGVNVIQLSARDFNLTSRQSVGTLSNSQLALLDGRSIYLDFFGLILWDLVPSNFEDIKQIEVVRGPASAVWGANALGGVVNIITKSPREAAGGSVSLSGGILDRDAEKGQKLGTGYTFGGSVSVARAQNDRWAYRLSAGYFDSDPLPRPTGQVPVGTHPLDPGVRIGGGTFSEFPNQGTRQPKFDARVDQELSGGAARVIYSAGIAGTEGIVHTGIGPFDLQSGSYMGYGRVSYSRGTLKLSAFANLLDAEAPNLQAVDVITGRPVQLDFTTQTYDFEVGHSTIVGKHHLLSYGGNVRRNNFDITIAPRSEDRNEFGAYFQDEVFYDRFRLALGGRVDKFGSLEDPVFSPRLSAMFKPTPDHALRVSYNKAFRSPSVINNYLDLTIKAVDVPLGAICQVAPPLCAANPGLAGQVLGLGPRALGSEVARQISSVVPELKQESLTAYEVGYTGTFGATTVGLAFYINDRDDDINFVQTPSVLARVGLPFVYNSRNPPPGWPFPAQVLDHPVLRALVFDRVPATTTYLNLGPVRNRGVEVSLDRAFSAEVRGYANYSWQDDPEPLDPASGQIAFPIEELSVPPHHRVNAGVNFNTSRLLGSASVNYVSEAYQDDVLAAFGFNAFADAYTLFSASFGVKWAGGKVITTLKGTNLANEDIRNHVFGDILKRSVSAEVRVKF